VLQFQEVCFGNLAFDKQKSDNCYSISQLQKNPGSLEKLSPVGFFGISLFWSFLGYFCKKNHNLMGCGISMGFWLVESYEFLLVFHN